MTVTLYNNHSDPTDVHKNLELISSLVNCEITEKIDVDEMNLLFNMDANFNNCNYAYIPKFARYYFLTPGVENGNQMTMHAVSDPLTSFWSTYSSSVCVAERSTSHPNPSIPDSLLPFKPQPYIDVTQLATGFAPSSSGGCYILTVGGK